jgi:hypothetical protein
MKKLLLILLCLPMIGIGQQRTYVPDTYFEKKLISLGYDEILDDYVLTGNINDCKQLDIEGCKISDLTGIEDFTDLIQLNCGYNQLTSLDVSKNTALTSLICGSNQLTSLDLSKNTALTRLWCGSNQLTSLDLSKNTALTSLICHFNKFDCDALNEKKVGVKKKKEVKKVIGCMDETATNYNVDVNTKCDGCCTHNVRLKPISYNISFYKPGKFPDGDKFTMKMELDTYSVCVQERAYNTIDDDGYFNGYQDSNDIPLEDLDKDRFLFKEDVGFYSDSPSLGLKSDLRRAITLYMSREARSYKSGTDEIYGCVLAPIYMNGITVEIKDTEGVNHGVIRFGGDKPTLRIDEPSPAKWLDYRASNTPSGIKLSSSDIKIYKNDNTSFYNMTCDVYKKEKNFTSKSDYECIENDGGWITIRKKN